MAIPVPALPPPYKSLSHYLKIAAEHETRDPVVAYYCKLYALQQGMELDKKSPQCRDWLMKMMDILERTKQASPENEALHNEVVGQAHMEHYALQMFLFADNEDRAGRFGKNVVKSFYSAGMLFDVLSSFGEISEDIEKNRKYAKWKAAYIHRCLKNGETPVAGPLPEEGEEEAIGGAPAGPGPIGFDAMSQPRPSAPQPSPSQYLPPPGAHAPPTTPSDPPAAASSSSYGPSSSRGPVPQRYQPPSRPGGVSLKPADYQKAMKLCKYAGSALQYEDTANAIDNLTRALNLLTTGHE